MYQGTRKSVQIIMTAALYLNESPLSLFQCNEGLKIYAMMHNKTDSI